MATLRTRIGGPQVDTVEQHPPFSDVAFKTFLESATVTIVEDFTVPTNRNTLSIGPITVDDGVTVTVAVGGMWVVV